MTVSGFSEKCSLAMAIGSSMSVAFPEAHSAEIAVPPLCFFIGWETVRAAILFLGFAFPRLIAI
jgi:hypothetical protein